MSLIYSVFLVHKDLMSHSLFDWKCEFFVLLTNQFSWNELYFTWSFWERERERDKVTSDRATFACLLECSWLFHLICHSFSFTLLFCRMRQKASYFFHECRSKRETRIGKRNSARIWHIQGWKEHNFLTWRDSQWWSVSICICLPVKKIEGKRFTLPIISDSSVSQ